MNEKTEKLFNRIKKQMPHITMGVLLGLIPCAALFSLLGMYGIRINNYEPVKINEMIWLTVGMSWIFAIGGFFLVFKISKKYHWGDCL